MSKRTALVTGAGGQDAAWLCKLLLEKGYRVIVTQRRSSERDNWRLKRLGIGDMVEYVSMELGELPRMLNVMKSYYPDEVYNLAAQSFVAESWNSPLTTFDVTGVGPLRLLEVCRQVNPDVRFYQASSSEMFGNAPRHKKPDWLPDGPVRDFYDEDSPMHPRSPYGYAKLAAYWGVRNYRESYGMFACNGILFNHESELRGEEFVTRKITSTLARMLHGKHEGNLQLGNLDAYRDWGHAEDYVNAMWLMLQQDKPDDYVVATGHCYSVREFVNAALEALEIEGTWYSGEILDGKERPPREFFVATRVPAGYEVEEGERLVEVSQEFYRPAEVDHLCGDYSKARKELGWKPVTSFKQLVSRMVEADMEMARG